ncbi:hypothetical protein M378DRAFT_17157 [Amanita muscaria Koide BX008]|uniref:Uncharacterized protein n=1 Tax=Amanita muscaria (strain Koide BX008) TaxID=946122 RepID=A0A0C2S124_AMAMK|nr:hypothetical protein M378DRAFT_17157 [Amanita muscaria Koide BX008]
MFYAQPYTRDQAVPAPQPLHNARATLVGSSKKSRSPESRMEETRRQAEHRVDNFLKYADRYRLPFTHEDLKAKNNERKPSLKGKYEKVCTSLDKPEVASRPFSAQYYDQDGKPLFFYLGNRWLDDKESEKPIIDLGDDYDKQYVNRRYEDMKTGQEQGRKLAFDGIMGNALHSFHESTQKLCSALQPTVTGPEIRHDWSQDDNPRVMRYTVEGSDKQAEERKGVIHLVQGWIQQGQKDKGLFLSSPLVTSSKGIGEVKCYYNKTSMITATLAIMFKKLFPASYKKYKTAFEAGQWFETDPGPWLGRAIVYKLQGALHSDRKDFGPSACFPCGFFSGGEMLVPQFHAKFTYLPGHVCIFESADIWHKVATFQPSPHDPTRNGTTPGRISTVFFFPKDSYDILKDKEKGWGRLTNYGNSGELKDMIPQ